MLIFLLVWRRSTERDAKCNPIQAPPSKQADFTIKHR
jgi:hypothetical protein